MPVLKETDYPRTIKGTEIETSEAHRKYLSLPAGFSVPPKDSYIRVARVESVSLLSREMMVQFVDGSREEGVWLEEPVMAKIVVGSEDPATTYTPSATVYGRGDLCAIMVLENQENLAVSLMDLNDDINRENFPTLKEWIMFDVANGINVDGSENEDDPELSFLTFWDPDTHVVTKIIGDPSKNKTFERMIFYWTRSRTCMIPITTSEGTWYYDQGRSGPDNNYEKRIGNKMHKGRHVNGWPYVEYVKFTNQDDCEGLLTAFHPTLVDLEEGKVHPLAGALIKRFFDHATVIWFDDLDPTHVVVCGTFPAWDGAKNIMFLEVPVYSFAGRKFLEREITDEGLETEERKIKQSWIRYGENVRILKVIPRNYIDWNSHDQDVEYAERLQKSISVMMPRFTGNFSEFGILDGYGWGQNDWVASINKQQRIVGSIERTLAD